MHYAHSTERSLGKKIIIVLPLLAVAIALYLFIHSLTPAQAQDTTITCDATALKDAIISANTNGGTITIPEGCTISMDTGYLGSENGLPPISGDMTIVGAGSGATIERASSATAEFRLLEVLDTGTLTLENVTVQGGNAGSETGGGIKNAGSLTVTNSTIRDNENSGGGGGISNNNGVVNITGSVFSDNRMTGYTGVTGGAISSWGTLTVTDSIIRDNSSISGGGGVSNGGNITIIDSSIRNNSTSGGPHNGIGGGILSTTGESFTIKNCTISGNTAEEGGGIFYSWTHWNQPDGGSIANSTIISNTAVDLGGGISNSGSWGRATLNIVTSSIINNTAKNGGGIFNEETLYITNSTISGNTSSNENGGGIYTTDSKGEIFVTSSSITNNRATWGSGIYNDLSSSSNVSLTNTLLDTCAGTIGSGGYNLLTNEQDCTFSALGTDQVGTASNPIDPLVGPLADNGGATLTHALLEGSPAIDAGPATCEATDQRGLPRPHGSACDIGAYEAGEPAVTYTIAGTVADTAGNPVADVTISTTGETHSTTTNSDGSYTITGLITGTYTLQAEKTGYSFTPASQEVSVPPDGSGIDFTVTQQQQPQEYVIAGTVTDNNGSPLSGVTISTDGGRHTATTNSSGTYTITGLITGTYTLQAEKFGYTFTPTTQEVSVPPDATGQDFTATPGTATLAGKVTNEDGTPLAGVEIAMTNGMTTTTASDGSYSFADLDVGRYRLTPSLKGYGFTPGSRTRYVPPDATSQDFVAAPADAVELWTASSIAGKSGTVAVSGTLAFAGEGSKLNILDVSNPSAPQLLTPFPIPGYITGIDVEGSMVYITDFVTGLQIVDASDPRNPVLKSSTSLPQYGSHVDVIGHIAYIADSYAGLRIMDVSNPTNPVEIGSHSDIDNAIHVVVKEDMAYVVNWNGGLFIVDVTDSTNPTLAGSYVMEQSGGSYRVHVEGDYAYLAYKQHGLKILDVSTPSQPTLVASYAVSGDAADVVVDGTVAYLSDRNHGVHVLDISTISSPSEIAYYDAELNNPVELALQGQTLYVADALNGLHMLDISTPSSPSHLNHFSFPGGSVETIAMDGTHVYLGQYQRGLLVVDVQDPDNPVPVGRDTSLGTINDIDQQGDVLYLARDYEGLTIVDKTTPSNPQTIATYDTSGRALRVHISGQTAYVADGSEGLQIIDVSDPSNLKLLGSYTPPGETQSLYVADNTAYLANIGDGVFIVDVSDPSNPELLGSYTHPDGDSVIDVFAVGEVMYLALFSSGLTIFDISDPSNPIQTGVHDTYSYTQGVMVVGNLAYIADTWHGIYVIDISDPTNPRYAGDFETPGTTAMGMAITDQVVYVPDGGGGLHLLHQRIDRYTVSGTVTDGNGEPMADVTLTAGDGIPSVTTGSDGSYTFAELPKGTYTIQAEKTGYTFTPATQEVSVPPDGSRIDFTATPISIQGQILDSNDEPLAGVVISSGEGHEATTDQQGTYTMTGIISGTYTLTPELVGYSFDPLTRTVSVPPSKTDQDFTATLQNYTISGTVTDEAGEPLAAVSISTGKGHTANTNSSGTYTLTEVVSGTYTLTPMLRGYSFDPLTRTVSVPPSATEQDFAASLTPYTVSGSVLDSAGEPLADVVLTMGNGRTATTGSSGSYTLTNVFSGTYTLTPTLDYYVFDPASRSFSVPPDASGLDFTASIPANIFVVDRDGFSFDNFGYYGADWEDFKKAFPGTQMELPNGERRKGPLRYFRSDQYATVGEGGNCAGFTAVSLIRFLQLDEGVADDLLDEAHRNISPLHDMPNPGEEPFTLRESDIADYIHLYQARQLSWQFNQWWFAQGHDEDTPQEVFQGIQEYTERNEPVAVSIRYKKSGHRMTAYRTEQEGDTGFIYVYDNNWPDDDTRRIEVDLTTGRWSYALSSRREWSGSATASIRYSPGSLNFPSALHVWYDTDSMLNAEVVTGTHLSVEGDADLLIRDSQGRKLGFEEDGTLVSDIPGAGYLPVSAFNPDNPDAVTGGTFFIPEGTDYSADIVPTASGSYTLTAFANGSAMSLDNIATAMGNNDTLTLGNGVYDVSFDTATDTDYCHYVTQEVSDAASRDYTSCISGTNSTDFSLDPSTETFTVSNNGSQDMETSVTVDQVGTDAHNGTVTSTVRAGGKTTVQRSDDGQWIQTTGNSVFLPLVRK